MPSFLALITVRGTFASSLLLAAAVLFAQTAALRSSFEVATIKPANPAALETPRCSGGPGTIAPGQIGCANYTLEGYIRRAYDRVQPWEVVVPRSIPTDRYDIVVKVPPAATVEQLNVMFQNLLAERFGLVVHIETRVMRAYDLVVGKDGPKILASTDRLAPARTRSSEGTLVPPSRLPKDKNGWPILSPDTKGIFISDVRGHSRVMFRRQPLSEVVRVLKSLLGRPVINKTGLIGNFNFDLTIRWPAWTDAFSDAFPGWPTAATGLPSAANDGEPVTVSARDVSPIVQRVLAAMEHQLGLKVVLHKGPVEVLVVDKFNAKPTEN